MPFAAARLLPFERIAAMTMPHQQGLYDPANEHDACGMGFVAHIHGERSRKVVADALEVLRNLAHRGAAGSDPTTGDGAGILLQIPHAFLREVCAARGISLPDSGAYGVAMVFLPAEASVRERCETVIDQCVRESGCRVLGWREVPTDARHAGTDARKSQPAIRQLFVARHALGSDLDDGVTFERTLYLLRKRIEREAALFADGAGRGCYVASLSSRTIVYKGMLGAEQLAGFYPELSDERVTSALALVHSRFSTNTFPSWPLAHPYRFVAHNGEINTIRGNRQWMQARAPQLASARLGSDPALVEPLLAAGQSDSASLDAVLELLVLAGRPLTHAMAMLIPEAWERDETMPPDRRAFYEYHASLIEPWDGPAAVAFTDGRQIGAMLDRNGLRPARYVVTDDDFVVLASEAGALPIESDRIRTRGRLEPGRMLVVHTLQGRLLDDEAVKAELASLRPYRRWISEQRVVASEPAATPARLTLTDLSRLQRAFGYSRESLKMVLAPMAETGEEAVGSMGNDAPLAVLSLEPQLLFNYFRQQFAQVTNPAIDPIREQLVMSLTTLLGAQGSLLDEGGERAPQLRLDQPVLDEAQLVSIAALDGSLRAATLGTLFEASNAPGALERAVDALCEAAAEAVADGCGVIILSDRGVDHEHAAIPALLAVSAVHHHLARRGLRARASLVVESAEAREVAHVALLIACGAAAVCPWLALETLDAMAVDGRLADRDAAHARAAYVKALGKGLLKVLSKMGISTLQSYCGAQLCEAVGVDAALMRRYFTGITSRIGGITLDGIASETLARHRSAFGEAAANEGAMSLEPGSDYHFRIGGEHHHWNPRTIAALQHATRGNSGASFRDFSRLADDENARTTLRGMLRFVERDPVPLDDVEPASAIVRRFVTGAMSFGSISREAHETFAIAMNRIGGRSNTGEGGEDRARFGTDRVSAVKQVASARFGVTAEYLVNADELQIKIAQGAKPGEGGQLPGHKVDAIIARTRCATEGVTLISPPPHHDIYSIEDLKQLIHDLREVNPRATISVKLVAESGVGTIAAGVAKAHADLICISGDSGGTGAAPLSSIKHAGIPWELGISEVQQTLLLNGLRDRVRLQTDGQLKTGRDVVLAALLGADEFVFATAPLIVEGCVMMRKCHLNTCPVGIATQDPLLRAKFTGQPEHVVNYFFFVAEEVREHMAALGARTMDEIIGRAELLEAQLPADHWKARQLDLTSLLAVPEQARANDARRSFATTRPPVRHETLGVDLVRLARPALELGERVSARVTVTNVDRAIGARLSGEIARRHGEQGLADGSITIRCTGSAGQSFGAFAARGLTLELEGEANDYVGKGLSGGRIIVRPPRGVHFLAEETVIVGNTVLYGATSGEAFFGGVAGQRFAVRNSGATAVVEGVGDHGCEYMTGGVVVVLGRTGRNFAAGMSGGMAFVFDESGDHAFASRCNRALVGLHTVESADDRRLLHRLVEQHAQLTGSARARSLLSRWEHALRDFVAVVPTEYRLMLERRAARDASLRADGTGARHG
jgi:glutamate synthase domain-containing protein 2/glutamate synthase domain-containing protein 1/glutamate synthase domain-containing protein 3